MLISADPVHAFVDLPDVAVANAAGGPLAGTTFAVKDIFDVAGFVTGCGNPEKRAESQPARAHAPAVARLLAAGARFVGKTHTAELAFSLDGRNEHYGTPVNPKSVGPRSGGSSSGSAAAVAAGLVDISLGSDTGGSVRGPASFCGLVGLRPTIGRIDIGGTMPLAPTFDTVGWFARDMELYQRVASVMLGEDLSGPPLTRIIRADDAFTLLAGGAERAALAPFVMRAEALLASDGGVTVSPEGLNAWQAIFRTMQGFEAWRAHGSWIERRKPDLNPAARTRFAVAARVSEAEYRQAAAARQKIRALVGEIVGRDRVIVLPTMPSIAPKLDASEEEFEDFRSRALPMLCIAGLGGLPQVSLPVATVNGCPLGLSLIGPPGRDRALLTLAGVVLQG